MARPQLDGGLGGWIRRSWRALLAEVIATALLVWLGCVTLVPKDVNLTHAALTFAFIVLANICAFGEVSGAHMNPAVTLAALIYGQIEPFLAFAYVVAQILGGIIGFGGIMATSPADLLTGSVAITKPGPGISPLAAVAIETVITAMLVLAVCGVWASHDPTRPDPTVAIKLGLVVGGLVYAGGPSTGASLNPARSFGPALLQGVWVHHWVYWVGPLLGGALAALLHRYVISTRREPTSPEQGEAEIPLNDKP